MSILICISLCISRTCLSCAFGFLGFAFGALSFFSALFGSLNFQMFRFWSAVSLLWFVIILCHCSRYASCLDYLGNLKANLLLDIHLHDHVETLYDQIRNKALIQYTHPFVSVDLHMMANAFKTSVAGIEKELEALITDNQIQVCFPLLFFCFSCSRS